MHDQLTGWLQVTIGVVSLFLTIFGVKAAKRRNRKRLRISHWKIWGIEHTRFDKTDDSQS